MQVWAICARWSVFGGQSEGNQNQLYLIQLGEERKLGNRNERRREGKRRATLPQLYQIRLVLVTFRRRRCVFFGLLAPSPGNLPGSAATGASLSYIRRCTRHLMPGMLRCLSFSYRGTCRMPPIPPGGKKAALFWRVLDVHKTSQIPSNMALERGRFGARGGSPKKLNTRRKCVF